MVGDYYGQDICLLSVSRRLTRRIWINLAVCYRREQKDGGGQRSEEPLCRGQQIVPNAARSGVSFGYFILVRTEYLPPVRE